MSMIKNNDDITFGDFLSFFQNNKSKIFQTFTLGLVVIIVLTFLSPAKYRSSAIILPKSASSMGGLDYNAQIMGLDLGSLGAGKSSSPLLKIRSFPLIITGQNFIDELLNESFESEKYGKVPLRNIISGYYRVKVPSSQKSKNKIYKIATTHLINVNTDNLSNSVSINVYMNEKQLSNDVLNKIIIMLNDFQNSLLQQKALNKAEYLEKASELKKVDLDNSENNFKEFLEKNINRELSPVQQIEKKGLQRDVDTNERIYLTLLSELEISKMEAVENLDRLHIVSSASTPHKKSSPSYLINIFLYLIVYSALMFLLAVFFRRTSVQN